MFPMLVKNFHTDSKYPEEGLKYFRGEIDKMLSSPTEGFIIEHYYPPYFVTDYLVGSWGFDSPVISKVEHARRRIVFEYRTPLTMRVFLVMRWDTGFKTQYRLEKKLP